MESAPGIVAGARTGLSTIICGLCFLASYVFYPLFASIPLAGTGPVLLMVGLLLFENTRKVDWRTIKEALPVFVTAIFCAFTYSILYGVTYGIIAHLVMFAFSGDLYEFFKNAIHGGVEADVAQHINLDTTIPEHRPRLRSWSTDTCMYTQNTARQAVVEESITRSLSADISDVLDEHAPLETYEPLPRVPMLMIPEHGALMPPRTSRTSNSDESPLIWSARTPLSRRALALRSLRTRRSLSIGESSILSYNYSTEGLRS